MPIITDARTSTTHRADSPADGENSEGIVVPAAWRDDPDIEAGDLADAELNRDEQTVTYHF